MGLRQMAVPAGGFIAAGLLPIARTTSAASSSRSRVPAMLVLAFGFLFAYAAGPGERQVDLPPMRAAVPVPLRWVVVTGALYVTTLGGVLAFTVGAAQDARTVGDRAAIVFAALNVGAGRRPRRVGPRRRPGRAARVASRTLVDVGLVGTARPSPSRCGARRPGRAAA